MTTKTFADVQWEDEKPELNDHPMNEHQEVEEDFASMLANEERDHSSQPHIRVGQKISGTIATMSAGSDDVLIDLGMKSAGIIARQELEDENGHIPFAVGDLVDAFVVARKGSEVTLSLSQMRSVKSMDELKEAYRQGFPIKGKVAAVNKGGFEITIMGKSAFCPISQISHQYVDMPQEFVGQELEFLIESFDGNGRNIVVSRSKLLKLHAAERLQELRTETDSTRIYEGVVTRLESYGAFVDLQGIEGMIHISEMSFSRIKHPSDVLDKGEKVRVSILRVEGDEQKPRISLSLKATMQDPWEDAGKEFKIGETYHAVVSKLIKSGAIAQLKPGIDGYIHVSEMAWGKRIHDPSAVVAEGETVAVTILDIDPVDKKIRLSLKSKDDDPWQKVDVEFAVGSAATATVTSLKGFGAIVELSGGIEGFVPLSALKAKFAEGYRKSSSPGKSLEIVISEIDHEKRRIRCKLAGVDEQDDAGKDYEEYLQAESARKKKKKDKGKPAEVGSFGALLAAKLNEHQGK